MCIFGENKKIKKELENKYSDYEEVLNNVKFVKSATIFIDCVADYDNACIYFTDEECKNYKKNVKMGAAVFRNKFSKEELKKVLEDMFLNCVHRTKCINKILLLIYE